MVPGGTAAIPLVTDEDAVRVLTSPILQECRWGCPVSLLTA